MSVLSDKPPWTWQDPEPATYPQNNGRKNLNCQGNAPPVFSREVIEPIVHPERTQLTSAQNHLLYSNQSPSEGWRSDLRLIQGYPCRTSPNTIAQDYTANDLCVCQKMVYMVKGWLFTIWTTVYEAACRTAPITKTTLAIANILSRPYRSERLPVDMAPMKQPTSYIETIAPVTPELQSAIECPTI